MNRVEKILVDKLLSKLVDEAVAIYKAMSPEQKEACLRAQRKSWVCGELMMAHPEMTYEQIEKLYEEVTNT